MFRRLITHSTTLTLLGVSLTIALSTACSLYRPIEPQQHYTPPPAVVSENSTQPDSPSAAAASFAPTSPPAEASS